MRSRIFSLLFCTIGWAMLISCTEDGGKPDSKKTPEELAIEALAGTGTQSWVVAGGGSVTRDGQNVSSTFANFELFLNSGASKTYTSRESADLFDASGTWAFAGANFDKFILNGSKPAATREISFTQTGTTLRLDFRIPAPGARLDGTNSIAGSYTFTLKKK